jgi:replication factor C subunit 3/5
VFSRCPVRLSLTRYPTSDVGIWDRVVVQDILKEIAQTQQVDLNAKKRFKSEEPPRGYVMHVLYTEPGRPAVVVINEADMLTRDAQSALRRTMESTKLKCSAFRR